MHSFHHNCKTPYSVAQVADIVLDIDRYPEFLPWCAGARVLERGESHIIADLVISFKGITQGYRSRIEYEINEDEASIRVSLVEGPFQSLFNNWDIKRENNYTVIDFTLDFELKIGLFSKLLTPFFVKACDKMLLAFQDRTNTIYGNKQE